VAVDVNTGGDMSLAAGLKANIALARDLPRQLRLRGLGGQITLDLAPMPKKERRGFETVLNRAFRQDGAEVVLAGWTPLGHFEIQKKRDRRPLAQLWPETSSASIASNSAEATPVTGQPARLLEGADRGLRPAPEDAIGRAGVEAGGVQACPAAPPLACVSPVSSGPKLRVRGPPPPSRVAM
jgi:hypothetical protein